MPDETPHRLPRYGAALVKSSPQLRLLRATGTFANYKKPIQTAFVTRAKPKPANGHARSMSERLLDAGGVTCSAAFIKFSLTSARSTLRAPAASECDAWHNTGSNAMTQRRSLASQRMRS